MYLTGVNIQTTSCHSNQCHQCHAPDHALCRTAGSADSGSHSLSIAPSFVNPKPLFRPKETTDVCVLWLKSRWRVPLQPFTVTTHLPRGMAAFSGTSDSPIAETGLHPLSRCGKKSLCIHLTTPVFMEISCSSISAQLPFRAKETKSLF